MRIINRVLGLLIAAALGTLGVIVIVEVIAYYVNDATPALVDYRPWLEWARDTSWSERALAVGGIIAAVVGLIWLIFELKPARARVLTTTSPAPDVRTMYTRRGVENAVASAVGVLDGVQSVRTSATSRTVTVSAVAAAREPSGAAELRPAVTEAAQQRLDQLQLTRPPRVKAHVLTARK